MIALLASAVVVSGLLAGSELVVRLGVQPALSRLAPSEQLRARQVLIRRLRWFTPIVMLPGIALAVAGAWAATAASVAGAPWAWVSLGGYLAFVLLAFLGTVPLNIAIDGWDADAPPADAARVQARWARIDVFRMSAALVAFLAAVVALALAVG